MFNFRLTPEEEASLKLRGLYESYGYSFYRMKRFEEYDFYAGRKDFLTSKSILTFTDINGKLMALRPDVTLSVIKHTGSGKFYYDEKVYRVPRNASTFHEISQSGIECMGHLQPSDLREVLELAILSLHLIADGKRCVLDVADAGQVSRILQGNDDTAVVLHCLAGKNLHGLKAMNAPDELVRLAEIDSHPENSMPYLTTETARIIDGLKKYHDELRIDFSAVNSLNYYNGLVFRGFIEGIPEAILSGGQYDKMMNMMGHKDAQGIGFAVYLDMIGRRTLNDD